jgi:ABC-type branched-subunit amino acid transport system substrate-binding protein
MMDRPRVPGGIGRRLAMAATVALAVMACGSGNGGGSGASGGGDIHIAIVHPFTGKYAGVGTASMEGAEAAAKAINAAGGINGRRVVMDQVDTVGDPADAVPALNKELSSNSPAAVIGPGGLESGAVNPILDRNHIPFMLQAGNTAFDKVSDPYLWRANPSDSQLGVAMALYALKKGYKRAAMVFSTIESAQTLKGPISAAFTKGGGSIATDVSLSPGQSSYRSEALRISNANPDVIFSQMEPSTAAPLLSNFKELGGLKIPVVGSDITAGSDFIQAITPAAANQVLVSLNGADVSGTAADTFRKYYAQVYTHQPLADANYAYDAAVVLALAMVKAGGTDGPKVAAAIKQVSSPPGQAVSSYQDGAAAIKAGKKVNYDGASGPMDYNAQHNVFGPFNAVQSDTSGKLQTVTTLSAKDLQAATPAS